MREGSGPGAGNHNGPDRTIIGQRRPGLPQTVGDLLAERIHALLAVDRDHQDTTVSFDPEPVAHQDLGTTRLSGG